jgi:hypothetical protein
MHELGRVPLAVAWVKQALRFWNKIGLRPDDDLVKIAMLESRDLAKTRVTGCWVSQFARCLRRYDVDLVFGDNMCQLDVDGTVQKVQDGWWQDMAGRMSAVVDGSQELSVVRAQGR